MASALGPPLLLEKASQPNASPGSQALHRCIAVAARLADLTKKKQLQKIQWKPECQRAFEQLKGALTSTPVLIALESNKEFTIFTELSI
ncbi:hypothetical protein JRQ81_012120 [Phrynocephalus forsythii]|uniref:Reverse transcriptase/retrotransposon-derived protein RNase H-like domain-containing protein n=1 Tax=Phrynocephalus forsythii TaxID=171643 RepID=A0A9Q0X762_9SAUR|nr:hypothetical protein JRQ81_012120 [Phrynocephalus forsythii]